ncbi:MAG TPA: hypothetical protein VNJ11_11800 [Bryobacteraceae bacterium]|nr:hypothetical protein [Bryobacteraceae bacterium]
MILNVRAAGVLVLAKLVAASASTPVADVQLADGHGVVEWLSPSTFRICRDWGESRRCPPPRASQQVQVLRAETETKIRFETRYLRVELDKRTWAVEVWDREGVSILEEPEGPKPTSTGSSVRRRADLKERFYGLGARTEASVNLRGRIVESDRPFLISSRGFGVYHPKPARYVFDLAASAPDEWCVTALNEPVFEYWFYYGPTPKEILEEHSEVETPPPPLRRWELGILQPTQLPRAGWRLPAPKDWESLRSSILALVHGSLSGLLLPVLDLGPYDTASPLLFERAAQLASLVPIVVSGIPGPQTSETADMITQLRQLRQRWSHFFLSYADEIVGRGLPIIRPLPLQFPLDEQAANVSDQFMIGDELLAAPVYGPEGCRNAYLPMGIWTEWRTNRVHQGRRQIELCASDGEAPLLVKNGSLIPIESDQEKDLLELHYFPKLAAEFFLVEPELNDYTQLHAAPALDSLRLEIESKVTRTYEWVLHHVSRVRQVTSDGKALVLVPDRAVLGNGKWTQEAENLRVRIQVAAGSTRVLYVTF